MAMNHSTSPPAAPAAGTRTKRPLDTVVKMALGVLFGSFALIWGGMTALAVALLLIAAFLVD